MNNNLNERYIIISKLGEGGFGETYLAQDNSLETDNLCVIKKLKPDIVNPASLRLFNQEAKLLVELGEHKQIPTLLDSFESNQEYYLVQEFIDGHDLRQEIKPGIVWSEAELIKLLQDILEILEFVHNHNVIHRDIKPANIMRRRADGKIILIDFGGVKQVRINPSLTNSTTTVVVGTPGYMPQEQVNNEAQFCSDIYALGILAIEALTGESINNISTDAKKFQPIWCDKAKVSNKFANTIDKMVSFYFGDRYQSVSEVSYALITLSFTALDWLNRGQELSKLQLHQEAVLAYEEVIKQKPNDFKAWKLLGYEFNKLQRHEDYLMSFKQAIQIQPDDFNTWSDYINTLELLWRYEEAVLYYKKLINLQPNNCAVWSRYAWTLEILEKYDEALLSYEKAINIEPDNFSAWYNYASLLQKIGKHEKALLSYEKAINIELDNFSACYNYASLLQKIGKHEKALLSYEKAINIEPDNFSACYNYGLLLYELKMYDDASLAFRQALQIRNNHADALYNYASVLSHLGQYNLSLKSFQRLLEIEPDSLNIWERCAEISLKLEHYKNALLYYENLLVKKPKDVSYLQAYGSVLLKLGRWTEADQVLNKALEIQPSLRYELHKITHIRWENVPFFKILIVGLVFYLTIIFLDVWLLPTVDVFAFMTVNGILAFATTSFALGNTARKAGQSISKYTWKMALLEYFNNFAFYLCTLIWLFVTLSLLKNPPSQVKFDPRYCEETSTKYCIMKPDAVYDKSYWDKLYAPSPKISPKKKN
jgi:eukaryotic-like serine/threonine-protein kinase